MEMPKRKPKKLGESLEKPEVIEKSVKMTLNKREIGTPQYIIIVPREIERFFGLKEKGDYYFQFIIEVSETKDKSIFRFNIIKGGKNGKKSTS